MATAATAAATREELAVAEATEAAVVPAENTPRGTDKSLEEARARGGRPDDPTVDGEPVRNKHPFVPTGGGR